MSLQFSSSVNITGRVVAASMTSSLFGTSSYAIFGGNSDLAQNANTASFITGSGVTGQVAEALSSSYALSASYAPLPGASPSASFASSSLTASYVETAQTASFVTASNVVGSISSATSASYVQGKDIVGPLSGTFSGSSIVATTAVLNNAVISGSLEVFTGSGVEFRVSDTGVRIGNILTDNHLVTGSLGVTGSFTVFASNNPEFRVVDNGTFIGNVQQDVHRITGSTGITGSLTVVGGGITGSLFGTASLAETASYFGGSITAAGPFKAQVYTQDSYPQTQSIVTAWSTNEAPAGTVPTSWPIAYNFGGSNALGNSVEALMASRFDTPFVTLAPNMQIFNFYAGLSIYASHSAVGNYYAAVNYILADSAFSNTEAGSSIVLGSNRNLPSIYISKSGSAVFGLPAARPNVNINPSIFGPLGTTVRNPAKAVFIGDARGASTQAPAMEFSSDGNRSDWPVVLSMSGSDQFGCWTSPTSTGFLASWKVNTSNGRMAIGRSTGVTGTTNGYSNTVAHVLTVGGGVAGTIAYATLSDRRDKEDITPITTGLDIVNRLKPVTYLSKYAEEGKRTPGYIAQDVLEVVPEVVHGDESGYMMSYESLTPYYAKAIQELYAELQAVKAELEVLKNK